jgi:DNA polymerase I-like protein with 3'-5' exonuclease and polymerase domains
MAKKKPEIKKSAAVRGILEKNPKAPVKEVVATLEQQGIKVSANYVYMLKSKAKAKGRQERREKAVAASKSAGLANPVELVAGIKALAKKAGGMRTLKQLVELLSD